MEQADIEIVIPSRKNTIEPRDYDRLLCKRRHLIENFFARRRQYRVIAIRYDKRATVFLAAIEGVAQTIH